MPKRIRIATRGSPLALAQAEEVRRRLTAAHALSPSDIELRVIKTTGDRIQDRPLSEVGGKGLFTKEIEEALLAGEADLAVHSMKDMATVLPAGLSIAAVLARAYPRDAFISLKHRSLAELPQGAKLGTSSLRRQAQAKRRRPDIVVVDFRGNVETRLAKLEAGAADATLLAAAGLARLGQGHRATCLMSPDEILPAVAQGAIGIEIRGEDEAARALAGSLNDEASALCVAAERAFLARLEGSCRTPIAGLAELGPNGLRMRGMILKPDGSSAFAAERTGSPANALDLGEQVAAELLGRAGPGFLSGHTE